MINSETTKYTKKYCFSIGSSHIFTYIRYFKIESKTQKFIIIFSVNILDKIRRNIV